MTGVVVGYSLDRMRTVLALAFVAVSLLTVGCSGTDMTIVTMPAADAAPAADDAAKPDGPTPAQDAASDVIAPELDAGTQDAADATPAPEVTLTGSLGGTAFTPVGARAARYAIGTDEAVRIAIYDQAQVCAPVNSGHFPPDVRVLALYVFAGASSKVTVGTYSLAVDGGAPQVAFSLQQRDQACQLHQQLELDPSKDVGTVTLDALDAAHVRGSFRIETGGKTLSGTFDVPFCDAADVDAGAGAC